jgi:hypothetical protein
MDKRKENSGTIGNKGGRKSKSEEQNLIEKLSPLEPKAFEALTNALNDGKDWAVKLFFQYNFGMPKQMVINENINYKEEDLTAEKIAEIKAKLNATY